METRTPPRNGCWASIYSHVCFIHSHVFSIQAYVFSIYPHLFCIWRCPLNMYLALSFICISFYHGQMAENKGEANAAAEWLLSLDLFTRLSYPFRRLFYPCMRLFYLFTHHLCVSDFATGSGGEREPSVHKLLVRNHVTIKMILVDRPCTMEVCSR